MNKIMVVDDDPNIRDLVRLILKKDGFAVLEAGGGFHHYRSGRNFRSCSPQKNSRGKYRGVGA